MIVFGNQPLMLTIKTKCQFKNKKNRANNLDKMCVKKGLTVLFLYDFGTYTTNRSPKMRPLHNTCKQYRCFGFCKHLTLGSKPLSLFYKIEAFRLQ